jgi:hypothetical protein
MFEETEIIKLKTLNWVNSPFEPEIDLNFLGMNSKIIYKANENKNENVKSV